jgi:hypothetical protein
MSFSSCWRNAKGRTLDRLRLRARLPDAEVARRRATILALAERAHGLPVVGVVQA